MTAKLYVSSGGGFRASIPATEIVSENLSAPTASVRGGVLLGAAVTASAASTGSAAPAGGTGATAGAYDTAANRDAAIATINTTRTLAAELQTKLNALLVELRANGTIAS